MSDVYDSVSRRVKRTDGALYFMLEKLSPVRQLKRLEQVFKTDVNIRDDKKACERYKLILQCISDIEFKPLLHPHRELEGEFFLGYEVGDKEKKKHADAREAIRVTKAKKTMELWQLLPVGQSSSFDSVTKFYFSTDADIPSARFSSFSETKKEMLEQLLHFLSSVNDEDVADQIYNFLRDLDLQGGHDRDDFLELVKKVTEDKFSFRRAQKILDLLVKENLDRRFAGYDLVRAKLTEYFGNAVRDSLTNERVCLIYNAVSPIIDGSAEEFALARIMTSRIAVLSKQRQSLLEAISYCDAFASFKMEKEGRIHASQVSIKYIDGRFDRFEIVVSMDSSPRQQLSEREEQLHEKFEALKRNIWGWLAANPEFSVSLLMAVASLYEKAPFWTRGPIELK